MKVATTVSIAANPDTDDHYLLKYFIGSQLAGLGAEWFRLLDNSVPSALTQTKFHDCTLRAITDLKVVALGNFKYFGIYFKMGYYLRISANKFEYLSVTRIGT